MHRNLHEDYKDIEFPHLYVSLIQKPSELLIMSSVFLRFIRFVLPAVDGTQSLKYIKTPVDVNLTNITTL